MRLSEKQVDNWFNTCEVRYARNRLLEIRDRLGYTFKKEVTKIFRENIEDENVQFFIKVMYECMFVVTNLSELREKIDIGFEENIIPSRFKMFFYAEKNLLEYLDSKIVRIGTTIKVE